MERAHLDRIAGILGWRPDSVTAVRGGYTPAARYVARAGAKTAFVKMATTAHTALLLLREIAAYRALPEAPRARLIGSDADGTAPLLILEDLTGAIWPPPWSDERIASVIATIDAPHGAKAVLPDFAAVHGTDLRGWSAVRADPRPFLALGLVSPHWLDAALPALIEAETACPTAGNAPSHWDVRSDNICFVAGAAKLIDWSEACLSNPRLDLGFWLPSLAFEGGPPPEAILPDAPEVAAWVAGYFAARAGLPIIPDAPQVRRVQRDQLTTALSWAARALRL